MEPQELSDIFAANVSRLLAQKGMTQRELANLLSKPESNISRMIAAKTIPNGTTIADVATIFGVDVCELLCEPKRKKK